MFELRMMLRQLLAALALLVPTEAVPELDLVALPGGAFRMGNGVDTQIVPGELSPQDVEVGPFSIMTAVVTTREFREFVRATKFSTDSETFGWSFVLELTATEAGKESTEGTVEGAEHWLAVPHSHWRAPDGAGSGIKELLDFPAVHLSFNDAKAYCKWAGGRLPTETEWEYAGRGGLEQKRYPWGDAAPVTRGEGRLQRWRMNVWQGAFPSENTADDGYVAVSPAVSFEPNEYGMHNVVGNVWEWTTTKFDMVEGQRVLRGGSFLDSHDGKANHKVTVNTRMGNTDDSASSNTGARCVFGRKSKPRLGYQYAKKRGAPPPRRGGGGPPGGMDQELLQKIAAEGGVEALQAYLGDSAQVMTPALLQARRDELAQMMEEEEEAKHAEL